MHTDQHVKAARSASVDAGALDVMTVDAGVAAIVIAVRGGYGLWIVALALLDGIPGAYERAQLGLKQVGEGLTIPLAELLDARSSSAATSG